MISTLLLYSAAAAAGLMVWIFLVEPNWYQLRQQTVRLSKPLPALVTILHLSDFHFSGPRFFLSRFFDRLARLEPDFIFLTGDFIDTGNGIRPCAENLKKLRAKRGIYAVLGNHDYESYPSWRQLLRVLTGESVGCGRKAGDIETLKAALEKSGVRILFNENIPLQLPGGGRGVLVGIDDPFTGRADFSKAFEGVLDNGAVKIALIHAPAPFPVLKHWKIDVAFSGHTHGGQLRLAGLGPHPLIRRLERIVDSTDRFGFAGVVSKGLGANPPLHFRFGCRPEALLIRLEGKE